MLSGDPFKWIENVMWVSELKGKKNPVRRNKDGNKDENKFTE